MTTVIPLVEYETLSLAPEALSQEAGTLLWRHYDAGRGVLDVVFPSPRSDGCWQLTPRGWVGHIPLTPDLGFALRPRVPLHNLFQMLEVAYRLQSFHFLDGLVSSDSLADCYERLAQVLARRVLARARQGFHRAHRPREERLPYVRGRIDLGRTLQRPWDARPQCRYETHTVDIADNQILAWTLGRITRSGLCAPRAQATVRRAYRSLDGLVTPTPYDAAACADRLYNRLNEDYHPLHALCRFFLEHSGPGHRVGERTMLPFLVHMARLYELFVAEWLRLHLATARPGWSLKAQEQVAVGAGDALHFRVDLVLYDEEGAARMVLDTKYKTPDAPDAADVAQVVAYAQSRGCREAVLVYPQALARPLDAEIGAVRVRTLSFALAGDLGQEGRAFLAALQG